MSIVKCEECGFMYEVINYQPCPTCRLLKELPEEEDEKEILQSTE